jgi:hypothetical protein
MFVSVVVFESSSETRKKSSSLICNSLCFRYAGHALEVVANERLSDWRGLVNIFFSFLSYMVIA